MTKSIQWFATFAVLFVMDWAVPRTEAQIRPTPTVDRYIRGATRVPETPTIQNTYSRRVRSSITNPFGNTDRPRQKPFSNISRRPTVSPYLNLDRDDSQGLPNYQTLVRPQLEQIETNQRQSRQIQRLGREFNSLDQRLQQPQQRFSPFIRETGHAATFQNLSHFYPRR